MRRITPALLLLTLLVLASALVVSGCARDAAEFPEPAAPADQPSSEAPDSPESPDPDPAGEAPKPPVVAPVDDGRPSAADAQAAVLRIAREMYQDMPIEGATIAALGRDSKGRWWAQGWTSAGEEYDNEQWFIVYDGAAWEFVDAGTGLERDDMPADIDWEPVP